ncbi:MAG: hypothetical protein PWQ75_701 [Methanolobus sp.]|uniref:glycosyltransferase n=1 Tax=Methanolobus sp. TaxID=1874737 RepID=UPI002586BB18|nr:glycosyltransferase [Methanolobus sp.]MDK2830949.1 hypothetical protein [Methanolobus sp.]
MSIIEVSVVIPTKNRCSSLKKTLDCLLNQTFPADKYEIIVCDDNSSDDTEKIVNTLVQQTTRNLKYTKVISNIEGPAKVRNHGIDISSGSIIGFTDDDCLLSNNWIETAVSCFKKYPHICGVYGTVRTFGDCKSKKYTIPRRVDVFEDNGSYVTPNVFYKKDVLLKVGKFDLDMRYMQDIELGWKVKEKGIIHFESALFVKHQVHCSSVKDYFKRQKRYKYWVLMYHKHPSKLKEDSLILGHIYNKSVFLVISLCLALITAFFSNLALMIMSLVSIVLYMWAHVFVDCDIKKYPSRILFFPRFLIADFIRFIISLKASIKYRILVLF